MHNSELKARFQFFTFFSALIIAIALLLFFVFNEIYSRAAIAATCLLLLLLGFRLAMFNGISENRVRLTIVVSSTTLLFSLLQLQQSLDWLYKPLLRDALDYLQISISPRILDDGNSFNAISALIITSWTIIVFLVLRRVHHQNAMGSPQSSLSDILPNVTNLERLNILKRALRDKLDQVDFATRWNESNYVSLEAEVQILEGHYAKRKVVDLLRALRLNPNTRLFVVLGEPGTGKSIALRKLARDLLNESSPLDRIPIYINLKEWKTPGDWSPENKPKIEQFHNFAYNNILQNVDYTTQHS